MEEITYINRVTGKPEKEQIYGERALHFLYGAPSDQLLKELLRKWASYPIVSRLVGWWQKQRWTRSHIVPFIEKYGLNPAEFQNDVTDFKSFNDFFTRKLKKESRPIAAKDSLAVIPADGRYRFFPDISRADGFVVKGKKFTLEALLQDKELATRYVSGSMVMARLCPTDYHRFHFPCRCTPGASQSISGWLYSVNPIALKERISIFTENKRTLCHLQTEKFGEVLFLEVGATTVGSICQTYEPFKTYEKGDEKGFFEFGGSSLLVLFEPGKIVFDTDLLIDQPYIEIRCLMGQSMGHS